MGKSFAKDKAVVRKIVAERTGTVGKKEATFDYNKAVDRYNLSVNGCIVYSHASADAVLSTAENRFNVKWK